MLVAFGENDVKSIEDLAGCATDDLVGWTEKKGGETVRVPGFLSDLGVSRDEAEAIIMAARVAVGWVEAEAEAEDEAAEEAQETA
jgi:N utilization substance protein A